MTRKKVNKILLVFVIVLAFILILGALFGKSIINKLITGTIKDKTGVDVNLEDPSNGNLSYTDPKTGQTLNIGTNKIPDNFPSDFPIYPAATVTSSLTGGDSSQSGFWLTLVTDDSLDKVTSYYNKTLASSAWKAILTSNSTWTITKGNFSGYLTIEKTDNKTSILIVLK